MVIIASAIICAKIRRAKPPHKATPIYGGQTQLYQRGRACRAEKRYHALFHEERPKVVDIVSWAAGNGDRSENGDYIYGKKRLREIDREVRYLSRRIKAAAVVDPAAHPDKNRVFFGATVTLADEDDAQRIVTLVGDDEAQPDSGHIGWNAPLSRALRGASVGDLRTVTLPGGAKEWEVMHIEYCKAQWP